MLKARKGNKYYSSTRMKTTRLSDHCYKPCNFPQRTDQTRYNSACVIFLPLAIDQLIAKDQYSSPLFTSKVGSQSARLSKCVNWPIVWICHRLSQQICIIATSKENSRQVILMNRLTWDELVPVPHTLQRSKSTRTSCSNLQPAYKRE